MTAGLEGPRRYAASAGHLFHVARDALCRNKPCKLRELARVAVQNDISDRQPEGARRVLMVISDSSRRGPDWSKLGLAGIGPVCMLALSRRHPRRPNAGGKRPEEDSKTRVGQGCIRRLAGQGEGAGSSREIPA